MVAVPRRQTTGFLLALPSPTAETTSGKGKHSRRLKLSPFSRASVNLITVFHVVHLLWGMHGKKSRYADFDSAALVDAILHS